MSYRSFIKLLATWARVIPMMASTSHRQSRPGSPIASSAAIRPDIRVIGRTAALLTTIQRVTMSSRAFGSGLVGRSAYAHDLSRDPVVTSVITAPRHRIALRLFGAADGEDGFGSGHGLPLGAGVQPRHLRRSRPDHPRDREPPQTPPRAQPLTAAEKTIHAAISGHTNSRVIAMRSNSSAVRLGPTREMANRARLTSFRSLADISRAR